MTFGNQFPSTSPLQFIQERLSLRFVEVLSWQENKLRRGLLSASCRLEYFFTRKKNPLKKLFPRLLPNERTFYIFQPIIWTSDMLGRLKSARSHPHELYFFFKDEKIKQFLIKNCIFCRLLDAGWDDARWWWRSIVKNCFWNFQLQKKYYTKSSFVSMQRRVAKY